MFLMLECIFHTIEWWFKVLECSCAHFRVLRSFELKKTQVEVVEWNREYLSVLKKFWVEEDIIWIGWVQLGIYKDIEGHLDLNGFYLSWLSAIVHIWRHWRSFELKRTWWVGWMQLYIFEDIEGHLNLRGHDLSWLSAIVITSSICF